MDDGVAAEIVDLALNKPELIVRGSNLPATAEALRNLFAKSGKLFDRGACAHHQACQWYSALRRKADEPLRGHRSASIVSAREVGSR